MKKIDLDNKLNEWIKSLPDKDRRLLLAHLSKLKSVFPFNEYEYRLMHLLDRNVITLHEYEDLRNDYIKSNLNLHLYGLPPRRFGDTWGKQHLMDINPLFKRPSKNIDKSYSGEYDLCLDGKKKLIKIEVKASRAAHKGAKGSQEARAINFSSKEPFLMNFQQIKFDIADIFVFIGVWVDKMLYWVLSNKEAKNHPLKSHQHRGGKEYQIMITDKNIKSFKKFLVKPDNLVSTILKIKK